MVAKADKGQTRSETTYHTRAVSRALRILDSFTVQNFELSVADLHEKLGIHKSTLVRLLQSMAAEGFIEQNPENGAYRLGIKTFEIGCRYSRTRMMNLDTLARPLMRQLASDMGVSVNLAIRDRYHIIYIQTVEPIGAGMRVAYSTGDRFGVHHTALGKAIVAFLAPDQRERLLAELDLKRLTPRTITSQEDLESELALVQEQGYAVDDEESLPGLRCVGAPVWSDEQVVAALSASGSTLTITKERVETVASAVIETAQGISTLLGDVPSSH